MRTWAVGSRRGSPPGSAERRLLELGIHLPDPPSPAVADAASDLFRDIFGSDKLAVRLVIGVASLPLGIPIELEIIFEVA